MWKFDPFAVDLVFVAGGAGQIVSGSLNFGEELFSDLSVDTGERDNENSEIDSGLRIIDGNI